MRLIVIILCFLIAGCTTTEYVYRDVATVVHHPPRPQAIKTVDVEWKIVTDKTIKKDDVFVALEYNKFLEFMEHIVDINAFIKSQNNMLCVYRTDLKELICEGKNGH